MSGTSTDRGPYRTSAEIEKEVKPTRFQNFINWWKDPDHYSLVGIVVTLVGLLSILLIPSIIHDRRVKEHGILVCQKDYYVETKYPAVGLRKIICLSASGEEKNVYEETNK